MCNTGKSFGQKMHCGRVCEAILGRLGGVGWCCRGHRVRRCAGSHPVGPWPPCAGAAEAPERRFCNFFAAGCKFFPKKFWRFGKSDYLCTRLQEARALSSAGLEHLPYKQRVGGSNPSAPTRVRDISTAGVSFAFTAFRAVAGSVAAGGSRWHENLPVACRTRWGIREAGGNGWHGFHAGSVPKTT